MTLLVNGNAFEPLPSVLVAPIGDTMVFCAERHAVNATRAIETVVRVLMYGMKREERIGGLAPSPEIAEE